MKKLLAIFLAVTMIATFIPSAFAVETEGEGEQISIVCDLGNLLKDYGSTVSLSQLNTDSNGIFKYVRSSLTTDTTVKDGVYATEAAASGNTIKVAGIVPNLHLRIFGGRYICFEITVPKNGVYSLTTVSQKNTRGQPLNVYMTDAATYYAQDTFEIANLGEIEGTINCYDSTSSYSDITSSGDWELVTVFENKTLAAGRYVITFQGAGQTGV
ncbi:MAG: hypothetical protein IJB42_03525, partial [Oscillospiraceae bacterium]|nr:hypothetical protein [Oscillospiraceae bacterium]